MAVAFRPLGQRRSREPLRGSKFGCDAVAPARPRALDTETHNGTLQAAAYVFSRRPDFAGIIARWRRPVIDRASLLGRGQRELDGSSASSNRFGSVASRPSCNSSRAIGSPGLRRRIQGVSSATALTVLRNHGRSRCPPNRRPRALTRPPPSGEFRSLVIPVRPPAGPSIPQAPVGLHRRRADNDRASLSVTPRASSASTEVR